MPPPRLKRSNTAGQVPASLADGEIAINQADGKLFYQTSAGGVSTFVATPADGSVTTAKIANGAVVTVDIADAAVTYAKVQNVSATDRLLGRSTAGAGVVEEIPCTAFGRSLINDAHAAEARATLGLSTAFDGAGGTVSAPTFTFTSDTNTGVYSPGADQWAVSTGGVQRLVISAAGDVGIGVASVANVRLNNYHTVTNTAGASCHQVLADPIATASGAYSASGISGTLRTDVATGVTDTGAKRGTNVLALRNHKGAAGTDAGTLSFLRGSEIAYGHSNLNAALTPTTTQVVGMYLQPYAGPGTVTDMYDLFIATDALGTGTVTNRYAIFQQSSTAKNYFAGHIGIGTTSPSLSSGVGVHIAGSTMRIGQSRTPASSTATGNTGEICWDSSYVYVCTATNTWRRSALSSW